MTVVDFQVQGVLMAQWGGLLSQGLMSWPDPMDRRRACGTHRRDRREWGVEEEREWMNR